MWIDKIVDITLDSHDNDNNERVCLFSFFLGGKEAIVIQIKVDNKNETKHTNGQDTDEL